MSIPQSRRIHSGLWLLLGIGILSQSCLPSAYAVVLHTGNGNTTAPVDDPGFNYVGKIPSQIGSIVYLGNQYAITANHVTLGSSVQLRPTGTFQTFNVDPNGFGSGVATKRLLSSDNSNADLKMFRLTTDPGLAPLSIITSGPTVGDDVVMIGNGKDHATDHEWKVTGSPPPSVGYLTWSEVPPDPGPANVAGFDLTGRTIRWGVNEANQVGQFTSLGGYGTIDYFTTIFNGKYANSGSALTDEAQAVEGDSGGGVFQKIGGQWYLAGLMHAMLQFDNQPGNTAVYGNGTMISDFSVYRSQIMTYVPEPATFGLALAAVLVVCRVARTGRKIR